MARVIALFLAVFFISCSENSDSGTDPTLNLGLGSFVVTIDGSDWSATQGFVFASISTSDSISSALITAAKSITIDNTDGFGISFSNILSGNPGLEDTYQLDGTAAASIVLVKSVSDTDVSYHSISGELKVTEVTASNIKGTFSATLQNQENENDTLSLTGGAFNAPIVSD